MATDFMMTMTLIVFAPFAFLGMYKLFSFMFDKIRVLRGQIKVVKKLPNDRLTSFWKRPDGDKIHLKDKSIIIKTSKDWAYFNGTVPTIYLDENDQQLQLNSEGGKVPSDEYGKMYDIAYLSGRVAVLQENKRMILFLMIAMFASIGAICAIIFFNFQTQDAISSLPAKIAELIPVAAG